MVFPLLVNPPHVLPFRIGREDLVAKIALFALLMHPLDVAPERRRQEGLEVATTARVAPLSRFTLMREEVVAQLPDGLVADGALLPLLGNVLSVVVFSQLGSGVRPEAATGLGTNVGFNIGVICDEVVLIVPGCRLFAAKTTLGYYAAIYLHCCLFRDKS